MTVTDIPTPSREPFCFDGRDTDDGRYAPIEWGEDGEPTDFLFLPNATADDIEFIAKRHKRFAGHANFYESGPEQQSIILAWCKKHLWDEEPSLLYGQVYDRLAINQHGQIKPLEELKDRSDEELQRIAVAWRDFRPQWAKYADEVETYIAERKGA
jgi:hypothetical protein